MFVSDELVFLQLQKTAGTHIAALLAHHLDGTMRGKHGPLYFEPGDRLVVGSVRNPWDWYVSLWTYGCSESGGLQGLLRGTHKSTVLRICGTAWRNPALWRGALWDISAHARRDPAFWRYVYADPLDAERFRLWLMEILSPDGRCLLGSDYGKRSLADFTGYYTYRFLSVFTWLNSWRYSAKSIKRIEDVSTFFERHSTLHMLIRNENLEEDLAAVFERIGRPEVTADVLLQERINSSKREPVEYYYDEPTCQLVEHFDQFIIRRFGYEPPSVTNI